MSRVPLWLLVFMLVLAAPAAAQTATQRGVVDETVAALAKDPVYVAADADPALSAAEQQSIRDAIRKANAGPIYVAVLDPDAVNEAGGDSNELLRSIGMAAKREGTYVLAVGRELRAGSTLLERGAAGRLAEEAIDARRDDGLAAIVLDLVQRVSDARAGRTVREEKGDDGGGPSGWLLLGLLGAVAALFGLSARRKRTAERAQLAADMEEVGAVARSDVVALGDDIRSLDLDIEMPGIDPAARDDYSRALAAYERADQAMARAQRPEDFAAVTEAVEEGRFAIVAAKARLDGQAPPERRPPCFFDPRHGPSVRDVEWAPPGGAPRAVPACGADALAVEEGRDPATREVMIDGERRPYWDASPAYAGWAGGFYGGFGGFFPGLLFGTMLGGSLGGFGIGDAYGSGHGDAGGGGDFGDFGGGGFGGGDFGGGDFGGGGGDF
jgi:hypothetical protein